MSEDGWSLLLGFSSLLALGAFCGWVFGRLGLAQEQWSDAAAWDSKVEEALLRQRIAAARERRTMVSSVQWIADQLRAASGNVESWPEWKRQGSTSSRPSKARDKD